MAETSLIPTVIALSGFFAENFPNISWYPNWYLGNPYHYLIGPVTPILLAIFHFPGSIFHFSMTQIYLGLILLSFIVGSFGLFLFLRGWGVGRRQALLSAVIYFIFPAGYYLLYYQNGLSHIAFGFLPFAFLLFRKFLASDPRSRVSIFLSLFFAFLLLIDIHMLLPLIIGIVALFISDGQFHPWGVPQAQHHPRGDRVGVIDYIIKTILVFIFAIFLSSIWYTPGFWWILLSNPSLGGIPLSNLALSLIKALFNFLPVVLAILIVKWRHLKPQKYLFFGIIFLSSFSFLTMIRFLLDPDFIADWIGFGLELQFSLAIVAGAILSKFKIQNSKFSPRGEAGKIAIQNSKVFFVCVFILILSATTSGYFLKDLNSLSKSDYQDKIVSMLKDNVKSGERVFLSGSSVFWINSKIDLLQIRGGVDQASIHPFWAHAAYQIREGSKSELTENWLKALGVSYVLVHDKNSKEFFRDFKNIKRFSEFKLIKQNFGDALYKIENTAIARKADIRILKVSKPEKGDDLEALNDYTSFIKTPLDVYFGKDLISLTADLKEKEVISLAVTFDPRWQIVKGQGRVVKDAVSNTIILPEKTGKQNFELRYKKFQRDLSIPVLGSFVVFIFLLNFERLYPLIRKRLPSLHLGTHEREEDY